MRPALAALAIERGGVAHPSAATPARLAARVISVDEISEPLRREWQSLAVQASEPNPFAEPWFALPSLRHLARGPIRLVEVRADARLLGLLLLGVEGRYGRSPIAHVQNWRHHHAFLGTPLVQAGAERAFWSTLLAALDSADWAPGFVHIRDLAEDGPVHRGLTEATAGGGRSCAIVHRECRAFLQSDLGATAYFEQTVRKKKRKELNRLRNRLAELGPIATRDFQDGDDLAIWCDAFLALEAAGWKGREGSALAADPSTEAFFRAAVAGAHAAGRLQFLRLDLGDRPLAMLVNFVTPPGSFSFKTAYDEEFARFSPGVMIQLHNLKVLDRPGIAWMDSCAAEQHPMIDSLWAQRRNIVRVTIPLSGVRRRLAFTAARTLEEASAAHRRLRAPRSIAAPQELDPA